MKLRCKKCKQELRGKRVWDNYKEGTCHNEFHCQNKTCTEFNIQLGTRGDIELGRILLEESKLKDLEDRLKIVEDKTATLSTPK